MNLGLGHAMRCLALAQAWQKPGGRAVFLMAPTDPALGARLSSEGITQAKMTAAPGSPDDARQTIAQARDLMAPLVVVDGYQFDAAYQQLIKTSGLKLLLIDDNGEAAYYPADLVLNQNLHAEERLYAHRAPYTRLLLGANYVLLRREFLPWQDWRRSYPETARRILITLGGSDPANLTLRLIQALERVQAPGLEARAVIGPSNPHREVLQAAVQHASLPVRLETNVPDISRLMAWADLAITGGGTTSLEAAFMSLPNMIVILAENQVQLAAKMQESGAAINMGWFHSLNQDMLAQSLLGLAGDPQKRRAMGEQGRLLVNGRGAQSVVDAILSAI